MSLADDILEVMTRAWESQPAPRCPPHLVHPKFMGPDWMLVMGEMQHNVQPSEMHVPCANLCGTVLYFRPVKK